MWGRAGLSNDAPNNWAVRTGKIRSSWRKYRKVAAAKYPITSEVRIFAKNEELLDAIGHLYTLKGHSATLGLPVYWPPSSV
jgi:hypothetical protein